MVILELDIQHFGKLKNKKIEIRPGMNVIAGSKNAGKSTIALFLKAVLFGLSENEEAYQKALPLDADGVFGGSVRVVENGLFYLISRSFVANEETLTVYKLPDKIEVEDPKAWLDKALANMDLKTYEQAGFLNEAMFNQKAYDKKAAADEESPELLEYRETLKNLEEKKNALLEKLKEETRVEEVPEEKPSIDNSKMDDLVRESLRIQKEAKELKRQLAGLKRMLMDYADVNEKGLGGRNLGAVLCLTFGILAGIFAYFYVSTEKIEAFDFSSLAQWPLWASVGGGAILFLAGLIWAILFSVKKTKLLKRLQKKEELYEQACKAEKMYEQNIKKGMLISKDVQNQAKIAEKADTKTIPMDPAISNAELASLETSIASIKEMEEKEIEKQAEKKDSLGKVAVLKEMVCEFLEKDVNKTVPLILDEVIDGFTKAEHDDAVYYLRSIGRQVILFTEQKSENK